MKKSILSPSKHLYTIICSRPSLLSALPKHGCQITTQADQKIPPWLPLCREVLKSNLLFCNPSSVSASFRARRLPISSCLFFVSSKTGFGQGCGHFLFSYMLSLFPDTLCFVLSQQNDLTCLLRRFLQNLIRFCFCITK